MRKQLIYGILLATMALGLTACDGSNYKKATELYNNGQYAEAAEIFTELGDYEDSADMVLACQYGEAKALYEAGNYEGALGKFEGIREYENSAEYIAKAEHEIMVMTYADVLEQLEENDWYYNGGTDNKLNRISFSGTDVTISYVFFDGNGKHEGEDITVPFEIDDSSIAMTLEDGNSLNIGYTAGTDGVKIGAGDYYTLDEVDAALQGYWELRESKPVYPFSYVGTYEYHLHIDQGSLESESANTPNPIFAGGTEYFYFGPYEGSYTLNFGGFDTDMDHGDYWFWNVVDGKPTILHYAELCQKSETEGMPGQNGYSF